MRSFTDPAGNLLEYQPWFVGEDDGKWQAVTELEMRAQGNALVARLNGATQPEMTTALRGLLVAVDRKQLPDTDPHEYYFNDLERKSVFTKDGVRLGKVNQVMTTGASAVLDVSCDDAEYLIPFVRSVIDSVGDDKITVDWDKDWKK